MKIIGEKTKAVNAIVNAISAFRFNYDKVGMQGSYHNDPIGIHPLHAPIYRAIGYKVYYRGFSISVDFELREIIIDNNN